MTFSIKKIFNKTEDKTKNVEAEEPIANKTSDKGAEKGTKHDSPTGCCGSCS